jgi:glycosyltransferase involved in cell wall biosynthesis
MNNFLSIVWYRVLPPNYGGQKGIALFNQSLGIKVPLTCLCSEDNIPEDGLSYHVANSLPISRFQFWNPFVKKRILSLIRQQSFTHIIIEHPWHAWLGKYKKQLNFRFIVHAHNIEHLRMKARNKTWWWLLKNTERKAFAKADHILFKTETDQATAMNIFNIPAEKCIVVPYGIIEKQQPDPGQEIKKEIKKQYNISEEEKILLFAGTLEYEPNARALEVIVHDILPLLQKKKFRFRLLICGALPEEKMKELNAIPGVKATGYVPSVADFMQSCDVFINPVTGGSGIQTKNIEAIANGCNVVTTVFAATGLPVYLINKKIFASARGDWEHFADNIIAVSSQRTDVPQEFYDEYNWGNIIDRLLEKLIA